jgi:uncharacterized protein
MRYLLVPGRGIPGPKHWMQLWAQTRDDIQWSPRPPGPPFILADRVAALHAAVTDGTDPAVLIAHSAGCITTVVWAGRHVGPVHAALLVTPPYIGPSGGSGSDGPPSARDRTVPRQRLPFPATLVASRNDPSTTFEQFEQYAEDWGTELFDAGDAGHLDTASGYGPWPDGERLVNLLGRH